MDAVVSCSVLVPCAGGLDADAAMLEASPQLLKCKTPLATGGVKTSGFDAKLPHVKRGY